MNRVAFVTSCIFAALAMVALWARAEEAPPATPPATPIATPPATPAEPAKSADDRARVEELLQKAVTAIGAVQDYTGTLNKTERFGKNLEKQVMRFKFARPFKVYVYYVNPFKGREAIYKRGWNDGEVKVHKGSFPDLTVNLDPHGGMAMENNHHPVTDFGLESTITITAGYMRKAIKAGVGEFKVEEGGELFGEPTWKATVSLPHGGRKVVAGDDETLWEIAKRTGQDMFVILHHNPDYDEPDDVDEGDSVFVPSYFGGKVEAFFGKNSGLITKITTWDHSGRLYEGYEYSELKLNPGLKPADFDPDNKAYDF